MPTVGDDECSRSLFVSSTARGADFNQRTPCSSTRINSAIFTVCTPVSCDHSSQARFSDSCSPRNSSNRSWLPVPSKCVSHFRTQSVDEYRSASSDANATPFDPCRQLWRERVFKISLDDLDATNFGGSHPNLPTSAPSYFPGSPRTNRRRRFACPLCVWAPAARVQFKA